MLIRCVTSDAIRNGSTMAGSHADAATGTPSTDQQTAGRAPGFWGPRILASARPDPGHATWRGGAGAAHRVHNSQVMGPAPNINYMRPLTKSAAVQR